MEPILGEAENMLAEWKVIQGVIPNLDVWVGLTRRLTGPDVMIDSDRWQGIASIGSGAQVGAVAEGLEEPGFLLRTGYTYSGHPTVAAAVVKNLEIMTDEFAKIDAPVEATVVVYGPTKLS